MRVSNETLVHTIRKEASYNIYARKQIEKNPAKSPPFTVYKTRRRYSPLRGFTTCYTDPYSAIVPKITMPSCIFFSVWYPFNGDATQNRGVKYISCVLENSNRPSLYFRLYRTSALANSITTIISNYNG
jgi:hypothetical protein